MSLINILGSYIYRTSYSDLPEAVISSTKERILDFLGVALSGYKRSIHKPFLEVLEEYRRGDEATIIGDGLKLPPRQAAFINSSMCPADITDGSRFAALHPGPVVIPAALAVSEAKLASGKDLILAIALGYEVMIRVGQAINPSATKRGFHPTAIVGPLGSVAAAGKVMNLDESGMINALSLATISGSGLMAAFKAPEPFVQIQIAKASEAGIGCALLAQKGVKGPNSILEEGFIPAFSDEYNLDLIGKDFGKDYMIPKTYIKMHGGCRHIHAPIDAALHIVSKHKINIEDIEQIGVKIYAVALDLEIEAPTTGDEAKFNIPFGIAVALIYGDAFADKFTDDNVKNEQVQELMRKVTVNHEPDLDREYPEKRGTIVEVVTKGGKAFSCQLNVAKGEPEWPLSKSEIEGKFKRLTSGVIDTETKQEIIDFVDKLETAERISHIFTLLKTK